MCDYYGKCVSSGCTLIENVDNETFYEVHVTVSLSKTPEEFKKACSEIGVKAVLLDLNVMQDMMTSETLKGSLNKTFTRMEEVANALTNQGFEVIRKKIETVPWNPLAKILKLGYYECHVAVHTPPDRIDRMKSIAKKHNAHTSRNVFKKQGETLLIMNTIRSYEDYEIFNENLEVFVEDLLTNGFEVGKLIKERAIYDSNVNHDVKWINGGV